MLTKDVHGEIGLGWVKEIFWIFELVKLTTQMIQMGSSTQPIFQGLGCRVIFLSIFLINLKYFNLSITH